MTTEGEAGTYDIEATVRERYAAGAKELEPMLCCPATGAYDAEYLKVLPQEILERDYGCGDPSKHVGVGETVVDLGSGAGKICYILSQKVGSAGSVIGVDMNDDMLALAREHQPAIAEKIGYDNVKFVKGRIQDMALDLDAVQAYLDEHPVSDIEGAAALDAYCETLRRESAMIPTGSVDVVVSNCVLNLVKPEQKRELFAEIFRVLKVGGRAVISDIVCDEDPTEAIMNDADMWSGCIAGAFREDRFPQMFEEAGFHGIEVLSHQSDPWHVIDGVEFRSMTIRAYKGKQGPCLDRNQAVVYRGPWKQVQDDDGHTLYRGQRMAVCDKTYRIYNDPNGPYAGQFFGLEPKDMIALEAAETFDCTRDIVRSASEMKGSKLEQPMIGGETATEPCCGDSGCC